MIDKPLFLLGGLAIVLASIACGLFGILRWLRKTPARYFFFELFVCVFILAIGILFLKAPPQARVPRGSRSAWRGLFSMRFRPV
jgi:hypothetical protein